MKNWKLLAAVVGLGLATSASAMSPTPTDPGTGGGATGGGSTSGGGAVDVPAPRMILLFGAAAGVIALRRRKASK